MEPLEAVIPLQAYAFLKPSPKLCAYSSQITWKRLEDGQHYLCHIPGGYEVFKTVQIPNTLLNVVTCVLGTTNLNEVNAWETYDYTQLNFDHTVTDDWSQMFDDLVNEWNSRGFFSNIIISNTILYTNSVRNETGLTLYLIGLRSKLAIVEAELKCAIALKEGRYSEMVDCKSFSVLPLISGRNDANWEHLLSCFKTEAICPKITFPGDGNNSSTVFLLGEDMANLTIAKDLLQKQLKEIQGSFHFSVLSNVSPLKLAYLKTVYPYEKLTELMSQYPSFINITKDSVQIQSYCPMLLDVVKKRFVRNILSELSEVRLWIGDRPVKDFIAFKKMLKEILIANRVIEVSDNSKKVITLVGTHKSIESAFNSLSQHVTCENIRFTIELDTIYKDFISGKKNGKLMKIMDQHKCAISLENDPSGNMLVVLQSHDASELKTSFPLLLQELPCEKSFFIPEAYHRPVIGAGGSVIQTIMRKNNVFIQFSNSFQLPQQDWAFIRYENVIIRCPAKNNRNMEAAKSQLLNLSEQYSQLQKTVYVKLTPCQYQYLVHSNKNLSFISSIERMYSCYISFPQTQPNDGFALSIKGNNNSPEQAADELISNFGREFEIHVKLSIPDDSFSEALVLPLYHYKVFVSKNETVIRIALFSNMSVKHVEEVFLLIEDFLKETNNKIVSKREVGHYTSMAPLYRVGKSNTNIALSPQQTLMKKFSHIHM